KALLFLGAGSVIHAMHHEQDMRRMGGLAREIPVTFWMMTIGTFALTGLPLTAGFFSKDAIIEAAFASQRPGAVYAFAMVVIAALFTSFYSWRLVFMTFFGTPKWKHDDSAAHAHQAHGHDAHGHDAHAHDPHTHDSHDAHGHHAIEPHESPNVMLIPLYVLATGALLAGLVFRDVFIGEKMKDFWRASLHFAQNNKILEDMHHIPHWVAFSATVMMLAGFVLAAWMYWYAPGSAERLAQRHQPLYKFLLNKWYFDELYDLIFVRPSFWLGRLFWKGGDGKIIDGLGPDGVSARVIDVAGRVVKLQTGYLYHYAFAMLIGVAAFITWYLLGGVR
ncbi:MAG: proton-conducting transporter membrane subunit, partial [Beijerinckiaceae bacterium]